MLVKSPITSIIGYSQLVSSGIVNDNKEIIELSKLTDTKLVVTTDVHFLNKEDFDAHNVFININQDRDTENYK